jgi:serine/threonine protein kinase
LVFRNTLLEYLSLLIITKLQSGPKMPKIFGFDLLIYKDCIEFSMEFCRHRLKTGEKLEEDLKLALRNLHSLKIIHFDIKPENICLSKEYNKYVFIDLGLHRIISEEIGEKT